MLSLKYLICRKLTSLFAMKKTLFLALVANLISMVTIAQNALLVPDTLTGTNINLTLKNGTYQFYTGTNTTTMGANGNILGPTLILNKGDSVNFSVTNQLADTTTIHWHGLHVSSENDGGPHTYIAPNTTWTPGFKIRDRAATYWYHPHLHEKTNEHVSKGIAGFIIVRDTDEAALTLPRKYGVDDFPLVLQTKDFDANKQIIVPSNSDDIFMVNATIDASLDVPAQVVRFRLLNGSSMRVFNVGLSSNQTFYQIASDGGLLSSANSITRLQLAPGERAEILVDLGGKNGQTVYLKSYASEFSNGIYGATNPGMGANMVLNGYKPNVLNGTDFNMLKLNVKPATTNPVTTIPTALVTVTPIPEASKNITRTLTMSPKTSGSNQLNGLFLINNVSFEMNVINYTIPFNNIEVWSIDNNSAIAHPFHIHDVQFYVLDRNGNAPPASEKGRKDVIMVKAQETVRFIAKFETFANDTVPYMYHCHMLIHEDGGMMGQFVVKDPTIGLSENKLSAAIKVFPNPSNGNIFIETKDGFAITGIEVLDIYGRTVKTFNEGLTNGFIDLSMLSKGVYFLRFKSDNIETFKKIVLE